MMFAIRFQIHQVVENIDCGCTQTHGQKGEDCIDQELWVDIKVGRQDGHKK